MKKRDWIFIAVALLVLSLIFFGGAAVYAENFYVDVWLGDTYDTVRVIYYISGTLQDTATYTSVARIDTSFSSITTGQHLVRLECVDGSGVQRAEFEYTYPYQAGLAISSADISEIADSIASRGLTGNGSESVTMYANDTSTSIDVVVPFSWITVLDSAGTTPLYNSVSSGSNGKVTFALDTGWYTVRIFYPGYYWDDYSTHVTADDDSLQIAGYDTDSPQYTTIYGYIKALDGGAVYGAAVTLTRSGDCGYATIDSSTTTLTTAIWAEPKTVYTDTSGYWSARVIRSDEYDNAACGFYYVIAKWGEKDVYSSPKIWATGVNVDVSDSLVRNVGSN